MSPSTMHRKINGKNKSCCSKLVEVNIGSFKLIVPEILANQIISFETIHIKIAETQNSLQFLLKCQNNSFILEEYCLRVILIVDTHNHFNYNIYQRIINNDIKLLRQTISELKDRLKIPCSQIRTEVSTLKWQEIQESMSRVLKRVYTNTEVFNVKDYIILNQHEQNILKTHSFVEKEIEIVNLSRRELTEEERFLLNKGLDFVPLSPSMNLSIIADIENGIKKLPFGQSYVGAKELMDILNPKDEQDSNLMTIEENAMMSLLNDQDLVVQYSCRGDRIVLLSKSQYEQLLGILIDTDQYQVLTEDPAPSLKKQLENLIKKHQMALELTSEAKQFLDNTYYRHPAIYGNVYVHETVSLYSLKPIISNYGTVLYWAAEFLNNVLKDFIHPSENFTSLKDSAQLESKLNTLGYNSNWTLVSFHVTNIYENLNIRDVLMDMEPIIDSNEQLLSQYGTPKEFLKQLLELVLRNSYFLRDNIFYKQLQGVPMWSSLLPTIVNLFMQDLESLLSSSQHPSVHALDAWFGFTGSIFGLWTGTPNKLNTLLNVLNKEKKSLTFQLEEEKNNEIIFLNFKIRKLNDKFQIVTYNKPIATPFDRFEEPLIVESFKSGREHLKRERSDGENPDLEEIRNKLQSPDYPEMHRTAEGEGQSASGSRTLNPAFIGLHSLTGPPKSLEILVTPNHNDSDQSVKKKDNKPTQEQVIKLPHTGVKKREELQKKCNSLSLEPNISKGTSLNDLFSHKYFHANNVDSNLIYQLRCGDCSETYIGETGRLLTTRIKEHQYAVKTKNILNGLGHHISQFPDHNILWESVEILHRDHNEDTRKIKEAIFIKERKSKLNLKGGCRLHVPDLNNIAEYHPQFWL